MDNAIPEKLVQPKRLLLIGIVVCLVLLIIYALLRMNQKTPGTEPPDNPIPTLTPAPSVPIEQSESPRDEKFVEEYVKTEAELRPDLVIHNSSPFENEYFMVKTVFVDEDTEYFTIIVEAKDQDMAEVETQFKLWVASLDIPDASMSKLNIEYILPGIPKAFE